LRLAIRRIVQASPPAKMIFDATPAWLTKFEDGLMPGGVKVILLDSQVVPLACHTPALRSF
jgi:hypothetical protein